MSSDKDTVASTALSSTANTAAAGEPFTCIYKKPTNKHDKSGKRVYEEETYRSKLSAESVSQFYQQMKKPSKDFANAGEITCRLNSADYPEQRTANWKTRISDTGFYSASRRPFDLTLTLRSKDGTQGEKLWSWASDDAVSALMSEMSRNPDGPLIEVAVSRRNGRPIGIMNPVDKVKSGKDRSGKGSSSAGTAKTSAISRPSKLSSSAAATK